MTRGRKWIAKLGWGPKAPLTVVSSAAVIFGALAAEAQRGMLIPNATEELCFLEDYAPPENSEYILPFAEGESYEVTNGN